VNGVLSDDENADAWTDESEVVDCEGREEEAVTTKGGRPSHLYARTFKEGVATDVAVTCNTIIGVFSTGSWNIQIGDAANKSCQRSSLSKKSCPRLSNMPMSVTVFADHCGRGVRKNGTWS
jgi:hypothetical protein